jgi:drug/metabolite transporter (DMT)-like permease
MPRRPSPGFSGDRAGVTTEAITRTRFRTIACASLALVAFAANSILCRRALGRESIDPATFSTIRLACGAVALIAFARVLRSRPFPVGGTWTSAILLFLYAVPFSFAYLSLGAGTGALVLFGSVQATMIVAAIRSGERPHPLQWLGLAFALGGLVYLVFPSLRAPSAAGSALMAVAGISWGIYSLRGRGTTDPLLETAGNFARAVPPALLVSLVLLRQARVTPAGALLAIASGVLASGGGYVLWYAALTGLTATRAAFVQLPVPVLTAAAGVVFLSETVSLRLALASLLILGGVALALLGRERLEDPGSPRSL